MGSITRKASARLLVATESHLIRAGMVQTELSRPGLDVATVADSAGAFAYFTNMGVPDVIVTDPRLAVSMRPHMQASGLDSRVLLLWARPYLGGDTVPLKQWVCGLLRICASTQELSGLIDAVTACDFTHSRASDACSACVLKQTTHPPLLPLSTRELDVFERLGSGDGVKHIADSLSLSVKTIESHRENIKRKLSLDDAAELFEAAILWRRGEYVGPARRLPGRGESERAPRGTGSCFQNGDNIRVTRTRRT